MVLTARPEKPCCRAAAAASVKATQSNFRTLLWARCLDSEKDGRRNPARARDVVPWSRLRGGNLVYEPGLLKWLLQRRARCAPRCQNATVPKQPASRIGGTFGERRRYQSASFPDRNRWPRNNRSRPEAWDRRLSRNPALALSAPRDAT